MELGGGRRRWWRAGVAASGRRPLGSAAALTLGDFECEPVRGNHGHGHGGERED